MYKAINKFSFVFLVLLTASLVTQTHVYGSLPSNTLLDESEAADTLDDSSWDYALRTSLTGSQASYRNWSQGGTDNISMLGNAAFTSLSYTNIGVELQS